MAPRQPLAPYACDAAQSQGRLYPLDDSPTPVELTVTPVAARGDGTSGARVILRHGPFAADADALIFMADSAESWRWYLCNLRSVLEQKHDMRAVRPL